MSVSYRSIANNLLTPLPRREEHLNELEAPCRIHHAQLTVGALALLGFQENYGSWLSCSSNKVADGPLAFMSAQVVIL